MANNANVSVNAEAMAQKAKEIQTISANITSTVTSISTILENTQSSWTGTNSEIYVTNMQNFKNSKLATITAGLDSIEAALNQSSQNISTAQDEIKTKINQISKGDINFGAISSTAAGALAGQTYTASQVHDEYFSDKMTYEVREDGTVLLKNEDGTPMGFTTQEELGKSVWDKNDYVGKGESATGANPHAADYVGKGESATGANPHANGVEVTATNPKTGETTSFNLSSENNGVGEKLDFTVSPKSNTAGIPSSAAAAGGTTQTTSSSIPNSAAAAGVTYDDRGFKMNNTPTQTSTATVTSNTTTSTSNVNISSTNNGVGEKLDFTVSSVKDSNNTPSESSSKIVTPTFDQSINDQTGFTPKPSVWKGW